MISGKYHTAGQWVSGAETFASHILKDDWLDRRHDATLPDRQPQPRPDPKLIQRPIGPVAVFGASNFLVAFPVAGGGDTASALAAGCPVVVKGHSAHPGIAVVADGPDADAFVAAARAAVGDVGPQTMLTDGMAEAFRQGRDLIAAGTGVRAVLTTMCDRRNATPYLFEVSGEDWLADHLLAEEVFGPLGLFVRVRDAEGMLDIARSLPGQLTCTLHLDEADTPLARSPMPVLERKAGRILAYGFPTGVEVVDAQIHGGPYRASTNFGATSVGTMSIRRWLRPVACQNLPAALLPQDWAD